MTRKTIAALLCAGLAACTAELPKAPKKATPVLLQEVYDEKVVFANSTALNDVEFRYIGKYRLADTIDLDKWQDEESYTVSPLHYDSFSTDGLAVFVDYNTNLYQKIDTDEGTQLAYHFPVYIFNPSRETKILPTKHGKVDGIQEAIDTSDNNTWRPIDCKYWQFCGCGNYGIKIQPLECVILAVPKYQGNRKGDMRLRLKIGKQVYISQTFTGTYNQEQFDVKKNRGLAYELASNPNEMQYRFLGATPKGY